MGESVEEGVARIAHPVALPVGELARALEEAGLTDVRVVREHGPFLGTSQERTARRYEVIGIDLSARKPWDG